MANDKKFIVKNGLLTPENVVIGSNTDNGEQLQVTGDTVLSQATAATPTLKVTNSGGNNAVIGQFEGDAAALQVKNLATGDYQLVNTGNNNGIIFYNDTGGVSIQYNGGDRLVISDTGNDFTGLSSTSIDGNRILTTADEGAGNGLDADTVDGLEAAQFVRADVDDIMAGNYTIQNDLTIQGDLTVSGNTTTVNTEEILLADNIITLNSNYTGNAPSENGGIEIERGTLDNAKIIWNEASDYWQLEINNAVLGRIITTADEGSGNGFDADTVDGLEGSQFLRSDIDDTAEGNITIEGDLTIGDNTGPAQVVFDGQNVNRTLYSNNGEIGFLNNAANWAMKSDASGDLEVERDVEAGRDVTADRNIVAEDDITSTTGNIVATAGDITATAGNIAATAGSVSAGTTVTAGSSVSAGTTVTGGTGVTATTGNVTASDGDVVASDNVTATTGDVTAGNDVTAAQDITATAGDITATAGDISATVGDVTAGNDVTAGQDVTATAGDVTATVGSVRAGEDVYGKKFIDVNDGTYIVNPNADSTMHSIGLDDDLFHNGDADTKLSFTTNDISLQTGGSERLGVDNAGVDITGDLDVTGDISAGGDVSGGTGTFTGDVTAARFVDADDTNYFADPAGSSEFHEVQIDDYVRHRGNTTTYLGFPSDNNIRFATDGTERVLIDTTYVTSSLDGIFPNLYAGRYYDSGNATYYGDFASTSRVNNISLVGDIIADGDTNTYIDFYSADNFQVVTGGSQRFRVTNSFVLANNQMRSPIYYDNNDTAYYADPAGDSQFNELHINDWLRHRGDTNTYIGFPAADTIEMTTGGGIRATINNTNATFNSDVLADRFVDRQSTGYYLNPADATLSATLNGTVRIANIANSTRYSDSSGTGGIVLAGDADIAANQSTTLAISGQYRSGAYSLMYLNRIDANVNPFNPGNRYIEFRADGGGTTPAAFRGDSSGNFYLTPQNGQNIGFWTSSGNEVAVALDDGNFVVGGSSVTYTVNDNTPLIGSNTNNKLHVNGSIQLTSNDDAIVFGRGTSTFLKDEELGFGWGGGLYMLDATYLRIRNNKTVYSTGNADFNTFRSYQNTAYYVDPDGDSQLNTVDIDDYVRHRGDTNTLLGFSGNDSILFQTNGANRASINNSRMRVRSKLEVWGSGIELQKQSNAGGVGITMTDQGSSETPGLGGLQTVSIKAWHADNSYTSGANMAMAFESSEPTTHYVFGTNANAAGGNVIPRVTNTGSLGLTNYKWANIYATAANIDNVYASRYYDADDNSFYGDFNSRSEMNSINLRHNTAVIGGNGNFNVAKSILGTIHIRNGAAASGAPRQAAITFQGSSISESQAGIYVSADNGSGTHMAFATTNSYAAGPQIGFRLRNDGLFQTYRQYALFAGSARAPLFYDSNNTNYYGDFASTSQMNRIDIDDYIRHRGDTNTYFGFAANDTFRVWTNGTQRVNIDNDSADFQGNVYAPRYYDSNSTTYYIEPGGGGKLHGNFEFAASTTSTSYSTAAIELRESNYTGTGAATPPQLGFHWGGVVASNISIESNGMITIRNNPGNAYEKFKALIMYADTYYDANNSSYYGDFASTSRMNRIDWNDSRAISGGISYYYTSAGNLRGYIQATDTDDAHFKIATSGGEDIRFMDGGLNGDWNMIIRGSGQTLIRSRIDTPIMYDRDDTSFYVDPHSVTNLSRLDTDVGLVSGTNYSLHPYYLGQVLFSGGHAGQGGSTFDVARHKNARLYGRNGSTWTDLGNCDGILDGWYSQQFGGLTLSRTYQEFVIYFANTLGYSFCNGVSIQHSTNGNNFDVYVESKESVGNPWESGFTTHTSRTGQSSWPGGTVITDNFAVGGGYNDNFRLRIVPNWNGGNSNSISFGSIQIFAAYGNPTRSYYTDFSRNLIADVSMRAPIFYDNNNTGYYVDPASNSRFNTTQALRYYMNHGTSYWIDEAGGNYGSIQTGGRRNGWAGYSIENNWVFMGETNEVGLYNDIDNKWILQSYRNQWLRLMYNGTTQAQTANGYFLANNQMRAPIYYDSNNTGYYANFASGNTDNALKIAGRIRRDNFQTSGNGDNNRFLEAQDYSHWIWNTANNWGIFWAGNNGAAYQHFGSSNPNEFVFVGSGNVRASIDLDNGNAHFNGNVSAGNFLLNGGNENIGLIKSYGSGGADLVLFDGTEYFDKRVIKPMADNESALTSNTGEFVRTTDGPFAGSMVLQSSGYRTFYSDYIPVVPGEDIYGEISHKLISGSGGRLYYGVERFDSQKRAIAGNTGTTYFVVGGNIFTNTSWQTQRGHTTIPTSHTPYNGSDGGGCYYVRIRILLNYNAGGALRQWAGIMLKRRNAESNLLVDDLLADDITADEITANIFRDRAAPTTYYVDPASISYFNDIRPNILYDRQNTSYYIDPASTSRWVTSNQNGYHTFQNYGQGITGTYTSTRLQQVFAMGSSYRLPADGNSTANMYGIAWSHPNAGSKGGANNLNDHGMLIINNGSFRAAISSRAVFSQDVRGTLFYDYNNTGYYVDPASTSRMVHLRLSSGDSYLKIGANAATTTARDGNRPQIEIGQNHAYPHFTLWSYGSNTTHGGVISFRSRQGGGYRRWNIGTANYNPESIQIGYFDNQDNPHYGVGVNGWSYDSYARLVIRTGYTEARGSMRAPIFYDLNNTGYYVDPASTTNLNTLNANQTTVRTLDFKTAGGDSGQGTRAYSIYQEGGSWSYPYPDLRIAYHTGIKFGANASYQGMRFYTDYTMATQVMSVNNGSDPLGGSNVYVNNNLQAGSSLRAPIFYDSNNTAYYTDPHSESRINTLRTAGIVVIGGNFQNNPYNSVGSTRLMFGGGDGNAQGNYYIGTNLENYGGNYTKLDLRWHTGIRMGAQPGYGGVRIYNNEDLSTLLFSVGRSDTHVRVENGNNLYVQGGDARAALFYDYNDTNYYIDPANNGRVWQLGIGYRSAGKRLDVTGDHGNTAIRLELPAGNNGAGQGNIPLQMWVSEPGRTWSGAGFGYNVDNNLNGGTNQYYLGRPNTSHGQAYMRFDTNGYMTFYNTNTSGTRYETLQTRSNNTVYVPNYLFAGSSLRAPIFYDTNDTNYYADPRSNSRFNTMQFVGDVNFDGGAGAIELTSSDIRSNGSSSWTGNPGSSVGKIQMHSNRWYIVSNGNSNRIVQFRQNGSDRSYIANDGRLIGPGVSASSDVRAPIFYDSDDTTYRADFNSTSNTAMRFRGGTLHGPNPSWGRYLYVGTNGNVSSEACVATTNGNLHLDSRSGNNLYLQWYVGGTVYVNNAIQAQIYYDRNNTSYYGDFASTSYMNDLRVNILYDRNNTAYYVHNSSGDASMRTVTVDRLNMRDRGDFITFYGNDSDYHSISSRDNGGGVTDDLRFNSYHDIFFNLDSNNNNSSGSTGFYVGQHGAGTGGISGWYFQAMCDGNSYASSSFRAPIFYDRDDTGYYVNPNSSSQLRSVYANDWFRPQGGTGIYWQDYGYGIRSAGGEGNPYGNIATYNTGRNGWSGYGIGTRWTLMSTEGNNWGMHDNTRSWNFYYNGSYHRFYYGYVYSSESFRAPIFYDLNDTGYYMNPNSDSNWQGLTGRGQAMIGLQGMTRSSAIGNYGRRPNITGDSNYWTGSKGWGRVDMNTVGNWGSGFFDSWSNPPNQPSGTSHWVGVQAYHYSNGSARYGWQLAGGPITNLRFRSTWSGFRSWRTVPVLDENSGNGGAMYAGIYYDSNNTGYYCNPYGRSRLQQIDFGNGSYYIREGSWGMRNQTPYGYIEFGPANSSHAHIYTDRSNFYFNRLIQVNGRSRMDTNDIRSDIFYDLNNTGYYGDFASTSRLNQLNVNAINSPYAGGNSGITRASKPYSFGFQENGGWGYPYPDMVFQYHTGVSIAANPSYEGIRFFNDYNSGTVRFQINGGSSYTYANTWLNVGGGGVGIYDGYNGAHFYPNNATSYGSWNVLGSRSGYYGISFSQPTWDPHLMFDGNGSGGIYMQGGGRWVYYHNRSNNCTGFASSSTVSGYRVRINGSLYCNGNVVAYSDARDKENIVTIDGALDKVLQLRGVYYDRKTREHLVDDRDEIYKGRQLGLIAQEVKEIVPEVVSYAEEVDQYGLDYPKMVGLLVEGIKDQNAIVEEQKEIINKQQKDIDKLKEMVYNIQQMMENK